MWGICEQCDESNVVANVPRIRNILLYKKNACVSLVQNMQRKGFTDAAVKFEAFGAKQITAESLSI